MYTYLVVDDEPLIRKGTMKKLESLEHLRCAGEAGDGGQALELAAALDPDIIITDMNMPVMDGTELLPALTSRFPDKKVIVISGYKDFEYMKHAIWASAVDYLLKPFSREALITSVQKAIGSIEDSNAIHTQLISSEEETEGARYASDLQMLRGLLGGAHFDAAALTSKKLLSIDESHHYILLTLYSTASFSGGVFQSFLTENGFGDLALYLQHPNNPGVALFILFVPRSGALDYHSFCIQIIDGLTEQHQALDMEIRFGISSLCSGLENLHGAFLETAQALNSQTITGSGGACFYSGRPETPVPILWERSEELLFRMEAGMTGEVQSLLEALFRHFTALPDCTLSSVKYYCYQLSTRARMIMNSYFDQISAGSVSASTQSILNTVFSLNEIEAYYLQFFTNVSEMIREKSVYSIADPVEKIKIYVQRNYQKNLSMEFVSSLFYLSRSYCSHLFKERTGVNFVDYVNSVRIAKAKELIGQSSLRMYQVARAVGYDNVKYFFRIFKKQEGVTPEEYKASSCPPLSGKS